MVGLVAPSRARGLKQVIKCLNLHTGQVAPSRARGLKPEKGDGKNELSSRAFTGAWIETAPNGQQRSVPLVAPSRARGLKLLREIRRLNKEDGRAFTGAWIETGTPEELSD